MVTDKIFITGATGCIGHYVLDQFIDDPRYELHLLVRNPSRFPEQYRKPNVKIYEGDMEHIEAHLDTVRQMHYVIHIATCWGDGEPAVGINRDKTRVLFDACDPQICRKIIYFSTASILGPGNQPIPEALALGTWYVKSKYLTYKMLPELKLFDRIYTVFPTMVFGGDETHPYSHISSGLTPNNAKYLKILRFFYMDSAFHFLHSADIAACVKYILENPVKGQDFVLGNPRISGKEAIETLARHFGIWIWFRIKIRPGFLMWLARLFRIKVGSWDRHCITHPFFVYETVNPSSFGMKTRYPSLETLLG